MNSLQDRHKGTGVGSAALLKQYNEDVRLMRENEEMLRKFELLLKKAEINDKAALEVLKQEEMIYKDIQLKRDLAKHGSHLPGLHELSEENLF
jgi:hypothetical protein